MSFKYVDVHCHIQFDQFGEDRRQLVDRMEEEGVAGIVVGCDLESSKLAIAGANKHEHLFASVGLHPNHEGDEVFGLDVYRELASQDRVVAIGECGLDYYRPESVTDELKEKQKVLFKKHVTLAAELDKPLIIHARPSKGTMDAYQDLITILKEEKEKYQNLRGDIHFFVGGVEEAKALIALGFTLSFTAVITFARDYDEVVKSVPLTSILSETDAPYVAPLSRRGQRNDPLAVQDVVAKIAEIRGEDPEMVRKSLVEGAKGLFAL